jgi:ABC-type multidrug transport system fused ATPase/permease subunit
MNDVVLDRVRVVESDTHDELLVLDATYADLVAHQRAGLVGAEEWRR